MPADHDQMRHAGARRRRGHLIGRGLSHLPLVRLLQLASPTLPIGAYSYSQGLEWAVESRRGSRCRYSARAWIGDILEWVVATGEAALCWRLLEAAQSGDWPGARRVECVVSRVARNGRASRRNRADGRLAREAPARTSRLIDAAGKRSDAWPLAPMTLPAAYALAARAFAVPIEAALTAVRLVVARKPGARRHQAGAARPGCGTAATDRAGREDSAGRRHRDDDLTTPTLSTFAPRACALAERAAQKRNIRALFRS